MSSGKASEETLCNANDFLIKWLLLTIIDGLNAKNVWFVATGLIPITCGFQQLLMTHNFPSLNDRTKMLSFFTVTSSWQSGEMTLLHRNKRKSRGQKMWYYACVCMYARVRQWSGGRVSELMTKVISGKGHADGLQEMASPKNKDKTNACDEERCVRGCVPTHSMRCCCLPESRGATELFQCQGLTHRRQHCHYGDLISIRRLPACSGWMLSLQHPCHFSLWHMCCTAEVQMKASNSHVSSEFYLMVPLRSTLFVTAMHHLLHETSSGVLLHSDGPPCDILLLAVTGRQHWAQSTASQEQHTLEAGPCCLHS